MANTYLTWTPSQNGTRTKFTTSFWVKRSGLSSGQSPIFSSDISNSNNTYSMMYFTNDFLAFYSTDNGTTLQFLTNQRFRDVNGWYHIVIAFDSAQATASNRVKFYVNGEQITSFDTATYPPQNADNTWFNVTQQHVIGARSYDNANYFDGLISHFNFCDGYAYQASDFGSTDSTTGEWKINTAPSVTYGTNGFFILKDGNSVTDQSGNSNNFTVGGGTLTKTEDSPSNVFATLNPLAGSTDATFIAGNTTAYFGTAASRSILTSTLGAVSGKYYWECKIGGNVSPDNATLGVGLSSSYPADSNPVGYKSDSWGYKGWDGTVFNNSSSVGGTWSTFGDGDIIGVAVNLDDEQGGLNKLYFSKNGVWQNSADPSNHSSATGVVGITKPENGATGFLFAQFGDGGSNATPRFEVNFGNGYFQQTAVASAGTNASGIGIFEYDVPTGFTALSTKGLNL